MAAAPITASAPTGTLYTRHALPVRIMHWINVVALTILLMSGLQIFNAHPALYWGKSSYSGEPPLLADRRARQRQRRALRASPASSDASSTRPACSGCRRLRDGRDRRAAFPRGLTIPGSHWLAMARRGTSSSRGCSSSTVLLYVLYSIASRHLRARSGADRAGLGGIGQSIRDHLRFRHPTGEAAKRYNVLQKLAYLERDLRAAAAGHPDAAWRCRRG